MIWVSLALTTAIAAGLTLIEQGPVEGYPPSVNVGQYLVHAPEVGAKVAVFGYPQCTSASACILRDEARRLSVRLSFDASGLPGPEQERLLHCDDHDQEQCAIVLYGRAEPDSIFAEKIWWRSTHG